MLDRDHWDVQDVAILAVSGRTEAALLGWRSFRAAGLLPVLSAFGAYHAALACGELDLARRLRGETGLIDSTNALQRCRAAEDTLAAARAAAADGLPKPITADRAARQNAARAATSTERWPLAQRLWRAMLAEFDEFEPRLRLAQALAATGRHEGALQEARRGLALRPTDERLLRLRTRLETMMMREHDDRQVNLKRFGDHEVGLALSEAAMQSAAAAADLQRLNQGGCVAPFAWPEPAAPDPEQAGLRALVAQMSAPAADHRD